MVLGSVAVGDCHLFNGGKLMPRITVQDGRLVLRDGKIGTGQACCCGECQCTGSPAESCEIDYIAVTFEFSFDNCGGALVSHTFILNEAGGWSSSAELADENDNLYLASAQLICQGGEYKISVGSFAIGGANGKPWYEACIYICNGNGGFITGLIRAFPVPSRTAGAYCCPVAADPWVWDNLCPGAYLAVPEMTVVLA